MPAPAARSPGLGAWLRASGRLLVPLVPLVAALVLWAPIRDNYFLSDDFFHLYDVVTLGVPRLLSQIWAGHLSVVLNAVFLGMFQVFGPDPRAYFWLVLLTHAVNVVLVACVIRRFTGDRLLACLGATLWGTAPALEGTLGWFSVYGQVFLTAVILAVLARLGDAVSRNRTLSVTEACLWGGLLAVGGAAFGTGLGVAAVFPVVALLALPRRQRPWPSVAVLVLMVAALLALYAILRSQSGDLDPRARELLSLPAMLGALPETLVFQAHLLAAGTAMLWVGFLRLDPAAHGVAELIAGTAFAVVVALAWVRSDEFARRRLLALVLLAFAAYGAVAAGRTTVLQAVSYSLAKAATWPRYHYLPLALLVLLACAALAALRARGGVAGRMLYATSLLWMAASLVVLAVRPIAIDHHPADRAATDAALSRIRAAVAATPPGESVLIENQPFRPMPLRVLLPGLAGIFVIYFPDDQVDGRSVRFAVSPDDWERAQARGGRIAALVVRR